MNSKKNIILEDKDILGMNKPSNQFKPLKEKKATWFFMVAIIILMIAASAAFYFKH